MARKARRARGETVLRAILFADTKNYSTLNDHQLIQFNSRVLPSLAEILDRHKADWTNTWGDAIVSFFESPVNAARCALDIRDLFIRSNWAGVGLPNELSVRIALHLAPVQVVHDAIRKQEGATGEQVNLAARIEPVTPANTVYATETFVQVLGRAKDSKIRSELVGKVQLPKSAGVEELYRVGWKGDAPFNLNIGTVKSNMGPVESGSQLDKAKSESGKGAKLVFRSQLYLPELGLSWNSLEQRCK